MAGLGEGAILGAIVGELLKDVIFVAKMASWCKENCKSLLVTLDSISLLLNDIAKSTMIGNMSYQAWLKSMYDLLEDAKIIVEACSLKKWIDQINYIKQAKLSLKIIAIDNQIQRKLFESNLITLCTVQVIESNQIMLQPSTTSSMVQSILDTKVQDILNTKVQDILVITVPFMANPFKRLKDKIVNGGNGMDAPMTIGLKERGGSGKTLLAKMVNNDKDTQRKYEGGGILWITIGRDATIQSFYLTMAKLLDDGGTYNCNYMHRNLEDQHGFLVQILQKMKILLILDDVWDCYPSNNRAMVEWLDVAKRPGSITLITTHDVSVLKCVKCVDIVDV